MKERKKITRLNIPDRSMKKAIKKLPKSFHQETEKEKKNYYDSERDGNSESEEDNNHEMIEEMMRLKKERIEKTQRERQEEPSQESQAIDMKQILNINRELRTQLEVIREQQILKSDEIFRHLIIQSANNINESLKSINLSLYDLVKLTAKKFDVDIDDEIDESEDEDREENKSEEERKIKMKKQVKDYEEDDEDEAEEYDDSDEESDKED